MSPFRTTDYNRRCGGRNSGKRASLGKVVHRIWQFESPLGIAAGKVPLLIAETQKNRVTLLTELASFRRFEVACARKYSARWFQDID